MERHNAKNRPNMIKVDLLQNGQVIATQESTAEKNWKYEFKDLAAYDAEGKAYKYEVKEQAVDGYQTEVHGYDITNTKVAQTTVEGTKTWKDGECDRSSENNQSGFTTKRSGHRYTRSKRNDRLEIWIQRFSGI